jgi:hypothetical protein
MKKTAPAQIRRVWHHITQWECINAGLFSSIKPVTGDGFSQYRRFLGSALRFSAALDGVMAQWPRSCEQFLTNTNINRLAWLGQSAACFAEGLPCKFRSGFMQLSEQQQQKANGIAYEYLQSWLVLHTQQPPASRAILDEPRPKKSIHRKIEWYLAWWAQRGYAAGLPEEVPDEVMHKHYAPSYKAIGLALLMNDVSLRSLGFPQSIRRAYQLKDYAANIVGCGGTKASL